MKPRTFQILLWAMTGVAVEILLYWFEIILLAETTIMGIWLYAILLGLFLLVAFVCWLSHKQMLENMPSEKKIWLWQVWLAALFLAELAVLPASIASEYTLSFNALWATLILYVPGMLVGLAIWIYLGKKRYDIKRRL